MCVCMYVCVCVFISHHYSSISGREVASISWLFVNSDAMNIGIHATF